MHNSVLDFMRKKNDDIICTITDQDNHVVSLGEAVPELNNDASRTPVTNAIEKATTSKQRYHLQGFKLFTKEFPDVTSLGSLLWAQIIEIYIIGEQDKTDKDVQVVVQQDQKGASSHELVYPTYLEKLSHETRNMFVDFAKYHKNGKCPWTKILTKEATEMMDFFNRINGQLY